MKTGRRNQFTLISKKKKKIVNHVLFTIYSRQASFYIIIGVVFNVITKIVLWPFV